jgi:DNA modification methylase
MPESVTDRPTKAHEYVFLLSKSPRYYYDADSIKEPAAWDRWGDQTIVKDQPGTVGWMKPKTKAELPHSGNKQRKMGMERGSPNDHLGGSIPWEGLTKNKRTVWDIPTKSYPEAHFATYPEELIEPCIKAGCPQDGIVLDPFMGSGTTGSVALRLKRRYVGIELNPAYITLANKRIYSGCKTLDSFEGEQA